MVSHRRVSGLRGSQMTDYHRPDAKGATWFFYVHYNPVKHGWTSRVCDWPHSTFHRLVEKGWYAKEWGNLPARDLTTVRE